SADERQGRLIYVKPLDNLVQVDSEVGNTIEGVPSSYILDSRDSALFVADGQNTWYRLASAQRLVSPPEDNTNVYISTAGLDTNSGLSSTSPVLTLNKALEILWEK